MRDGAAATGADSCHLEVEPRGWIDAWRFLVYWNRRCLVLLLALTIFKPWPPFSRSMPAAEPSHRALGTSRVPIVSLAFGADGQTIATTDESGRAMLWQARDWWAPARAFEFPGRARFVAYSSDGRYLAIGGDQPHAAVWDLRRANCEPSLRIPARSISNLGLSPDGQFLAVASHDSPDIVLWDIATRREHATLRGHSAAVTHLAFAPDGRSVASATGTIVDPRIIIWNLTSGRPMRHITGASAPQAMAYSPDSRLVACACPHEKAVRIWDARTGGQVQVIAGHSLSTRSLAFSPDGRLLLTGSGDGTAALWSTATGHEIRRLDGEADVIRNVAFSPDGKTLAATANDGDVRLWDVDELITKGIND